MKTCLFLIFLLISSCSGSNWKPTEDSSSEQIRKHASFVAETYATGKMINAERSTLENGSIIISDNQKNCLIDPSRILIGEIDNDKRTDAVVPIYFLRGQTLIMTEHLILLNRKGKFIIARVFDSEMKILSIKENTIYAEVSKLVSDSPFSDCKVCKEIVKYQCRGDSIVNVK